MPNAERVIEHVGADTQEEGEQETTVLSGDEPMVGDGPEMNTNEFETQDDVLLEDECRNDDVQPIEQFQYEDPTSPCRSSSEDEGEQARVRPRREIHAPKIFTYDQLGTPTCYSTANANQVLCQCQPLYREVQPMTLWPNPFQLYQPFFM